jgi:hypothetical protein
MKTTRAKLILFLGILAAAVITAILFTRSQNGMLDSDFFCFWLGGRMLGHGQDPYNLAAYQAAGAASGTQWFGYPYFYPVILAVMFIPLGWLPVRLAAIIWVTAEILALLGVVWILLSRLSQRPFWAKIIILLVGLFLFRPVIVSLHDGQLGPVFLAVLVGALYLLERGRDVQAGCLLAFLCVKPSLGLPILGLLCVYLLCRRQWKVFYGIAGMGLVLLAVSFIVYPAWIPAFLKNSAALGNRVTLYTPTLWGQAGLVCGRNGACATPIALTGSILLAGAAIIFLFRKSGELDIWSAAAVAICIGLQVTPYLWAYDQVFLVLPLVMITLRLIERNPRPLMAAFPLLMSILAFVCLYIATLTAHDEASYLLTVILTIIFFLINIRGAHARANAV